MDCLRLSILAGSRCALPVPDHDRAPAMGLASFPGGWVPGVAEPQDRLNKPAYPEGARTTRTPQTSRVAARKNRTFLVEAGHAQRVRENCQRETAPLGRSSATWNAPKTTLKSRKIRGSFHPLLRLTRSAALPRGHALAGPCENKAW